jgi:hypothetical protein
MLGSVRLEIYFFSDNRRELIATRFERSRDGSSLLFPHAWDSKPFSATLLRMQTDRTLLFRDKALSPLGRCLNFGGEWILQSAYPE